MVSAGELLLLACLGFAVAARGGFSQTNHLVTDPQTTQVLEIGTNFTAICMIINTTEVTVEDLSWKLSGTNLPTELYTKLNESALSVTFPITSDKPEWLCCIVNKPPTSYVALNGGKFIYGVHLQKSYPPRKPENVSCMAVQENPVLSQVFRCEWAAVGLQTKESPTKYMLFVQVLFRTYNVTTEETHAQIEFEDTYPFFMHLDVWVEAHNKLGKMESEHIGEDANWFVKTKPPSDIMIVSEKIFPTSLVINWSLPIRGVYVKLLFEIRFCVNGSQNWTYVPRADTAMEIQSFRLQNLQPDTEYITQVRCKPYKEGYGYWSDWSSNATARTTEDLPKSKPDLWRTIAEVDGKNERLVRFISKVPVFSNGMITSFYFKILDKNIVGNDSLLWKSVPLNVSESSSGQQEISVLQQIHLADWKPVRVFVTASNSVGKSPKASLFISAKGRELPPVNKLKVWSDGVKLWLEWTPPNNTDVSEYVVEWAAGDQMDWQRESKKTRLTAIKGQLKEFVRYNVSVYPIYAGQIGKQARKEAYLEEGTPLEPPFVRLSGKPGRNKAVLVWREIPLEKRQGFITNYTIYYKGDGETHERTLPSHDTTYTLTSLTSNTKYDTYIVASTIRGSIRSTTHSFTTLKYAPGEMESIVVGVSLSFLFVVVLTMLFCVCKKDAIKENLWPRIPNPGESTIGNWSPNYPVKAETTKENCLSGISVLDVDVCDGKSVFEEDKACLPLKKDKYLSEEHSSGIGGSSCMSSPRQSVSDSDEGSDMADTTASTVQYSSVVASNGYKGQTPNPHPQQAVFSRSESTQPLLDCEENPDVMLQEGSRQSQRFNQTADLLEMEQEEGVEPLDFCPLEEESEQATPPEGQSAGGCSSYMSQRGGYRPQ
ncbi:interleukin-6 receptor subunit beta isoform X2 [Eleginops maclovinus]|uniref:interleukin-6 receptor subunit beta isoform X2 n=1 Tax=Eleginops maclovinus TaxID=56733 RepID=UPI00308077B4